MPQRVKTRVSRVLDHWYSIPRRTRIVRFLLIPLIILVMLAGAYAGLREWALRNADHLEVTVYQITPGKLIYQHTFGRSVSAWAEHMLNDEMTAVWDGPGQPIHGTVLTGNHASWSYQLTFLWYGVTIETTGASLDSYPENYTISALGITDMRLRWSEHGDTTYSFILLLSEESDGAIPIVPNYDRS